MLVPCGGWLHHTTNTTQGWRIERKCTSKTSTLISFVQSWIILLMIDTEELKHVLSTAHFLSCWSVYETILKDEFVRVCHSGCANLRTDASLATVESRSETCPNSAIVVPPLYSKHLSISIASIALYTRGCEASYLHPSTTEISCRTNPKTLVVILLHGGHFNRSFENVLLFLLLLLLFHHVHHLLLAVFPFDVQ